MASEAIAPDPRVLVGSQGIFEQDGTVYGHELLFRAPGRPGLHVDLWNTYQQDRATEHVLAACFHLGEPMAAGRLFVNFTGAYLLNPARPLEPPGRVVIEVVESAFADVPLVARLAELRKEGHLFAVDDFVGTRSQLHMLPLADYVKIDYRDLDRRGDGLVEAARHSDARLIAERVESQSQFDHAVSLGFELFQGHYFERAVDVERGGGPGSA